MNAFFRRVFRGAQPEQPWNNREAIRYELFGIERLEEHARSLAIAQLVMPGYREVMRWQDDLPTMPRETAR